MICFFGQMPSTRRNNEHLTLVAGARLELASPGYDPGEGPSPPTCDNGPPPTGGLKSDGLKGKPNGT